MGYIVDENDSSKLLLSAINTLLQTINELPIESTDDLANATTAQLAEMTINEVKREVLSQGWHFNTDKSYPFPPDVSGSINIPANVLDIVASGGKNYIMRDWRLYDKDNFSNKFDDAVDCDVVWNMDFNALTHPIRHYITIKAARVFQARTIGDQVAYAYTVKDEEDAYLSAKFSEGRTGRYNILESEEYGVLNGGLR
jgi:hypothetical protein